MDTFSGLTSLLSSIAVPSLFSVPVTRMSNSPSPLSTSPEDVSFPSEDVEPVSESDSPSPEGFEPELHTVSVSLLFSDND